ncbi:Gfo/Idh/MocA family protein [Derxia gummosa]|uniref:Gfo/Idh/MocA family protein n=1 Tax=Derxia gummosa DSM 723 TaxID=1121388 RepID=A0A8B6XA73_9BURK|nr:Gfo/Idh/MocA family oxidoreductase [Derxia gummosa]
MNPSRIPAAARAGNRHARDSALSVRYAVVGAGWIAQSALMPAVAHTGNSRLSAVVTGDLRKARELGRHYGIASHAYADYDWLLESGDIDAIYLALPNFMHRDFAVKALDAGIHVLLEKPMATSEADCAAILEAARRSTAKLMIAYRLHFEPATLEALRLVRAGELGEVHLFSSVFAQQVHAANHRAHHGFWAGPVADMGPYPINAARAVFGAEPEEVMAVGTRTPGAGFDFDDTVSATLRFPGGRLAQFCVSYAGNPVDQYRIVGTKGDLEVNPGFMFGMPLGHVLRKGQEAVSTTFDETDQFGGELKYFSDCILNDRLPEPDGEEGLADVRVIAAIERALTTGRPQRLAPLDRERRPDPAQKMTLPPVEQPQLVDAAAP